MGIVNKADISPNNLKIIENILAAFFPDTKVWAYGSRAKWTARPTSDLDMVIFSDASNKRKLSQLREAFEESDLPFEVDAFLWDLVPDNFRPHILESYVVLQDKQQTAVPFVSLKEHCLKIGSGSTPRGGSSVYLKEGKTSFIRSQNIYNDKFDPNGLVYIAEEAADKLKNVALQSNDILLNITGDSVARVNLVPEEYLPARVNQHVAIIRPNPESFDPRYLRYVLSSPQHQAHLLTLASAGATRNALTKGMIESYLVPQPPLLAQRKIADLLIAFDDKINLNRQINQTLEQMAQTLFKSWFVDFDPVIDNALDAGSSIPEVFEARVERRKAVRESADFKPLPDDVRQLFPSEFEESELGWVPKGWRGETFNDIFDIASSKRVFAKDYVDSGVPFYRGKEITELSQGKAVNTEIFISEEKYQELKDKSGAPKAGDILITSVGTIGNTYLVREGDKFYFKDGNLTWIRGYKKERIPFFIKEWFKTSHAKDAIERVKIGTTQQAITIKALNNIVVLLPSSKILSFYENYLSNTYSKHSANLDENAYLEKLRDTLLPKLISGELRLDSPEVEQAKALVD